MKSQNKPSANVAIITRTKDRPLLLVRAIESVLAQEYQDWIHIILNDEGYIEDVNRLVERHKQQYNGRVHVIDNQKSYGMEAASNKAIKACDSQYIAIHDDDDSWDKKFLAKTVELLADETIPDLGGVICHSVKVVEEINGNKIKEISRESFNNSVKDVTLWRVCGGNIFPPISFLYKRNIYDKIGGLYNEDLPVMGDWEFNLRFLQHCEITVIQEELAYYYHRTPTAKQNSIYANSIIEGASIGGANKHDFYYTYLRNSFLRKDLLENKIGIGHLMNLSHDLRSASEKQDRYLSQQLQEIGKGHSAINEMYKNAQHQGNIRKDIVINTLKDQSNQNTTRLSNELADSNNRIKHIYNIFKPIIWIGIKLRIIKP